MKKLWNSPEQVAQFLSSRPETRSMPFLLWMADLEAASEGQEKALLGLICHKLVMAREREDDDRMDDLYCGMLDLLAGGVARAGSTAAENKDEDETNAISVEAIEERRERALTLLSANPELYAVELSQRLTGAPLIVQV